MTIFEDIRDSETLVDSINQYLNGSMTYEELKRKHPDLKADEIKKDVSGW